MIPELRNVSYQQRLNQLGLTTLEERRTRGDMIETFKIMNNYDSINLSLKPATSSVTRGHNYKLSKPTVKLDTRKYFFVSRIVDKWNSLPATVVNAKSVNAFKHQYDRLHNGPKGMSLSRPDI
ncbi:uncharacterized protein [Ptychodera flava]|uniref:uncharacterized protein n=1 Tax=Ptychodera flava TaxID=63121 RepID=UPI003969DF9A